MNKTNIKNFAIWARNKLIADIQYRAGLMGITEQGIKTALPQSTPNMEFYDIGTTEPYSITGNAIQQRQKLVEIIHQKEKNSDYPTAYKYILEEVAYTWFNRLIAIRFMEVNDYLPSHIRVLSSETGKLEPDLVTTPFDADLEFTPAEGETILQLKNANALDELFRLLFIKQCNALNEILPALFEKTNDYTELLLNLSVVDQEGVVYHLTHDISESDFDITHPDENGEIQGQVEIIGWLYQYYNTEPKNAAFAKNGKITKDEIPAVTQLFTPDWIVRYMVQNSLGRIFIDKRKNEGVFADGRGLDEMTWDEAAEKRIAAEKHLAEQMEWKYYLPEAAQTKEVRDQLDTIQQQSEYKDVRDIKVIDPCMGSGHILVYAFDVLMQMYEDAGYSQRDAAKSILENNLYGLDIDDRAYQLAYFAIMMKARQYNRRILNGENTCHVYAIQESNNINRAHLKYLGAGMDDLEVNTARVQLEGLLDTLRDAKEYGSILKVESYNWELLRRFVSAADAGEQVTMDSTGLDATVAQLLTLIDIGETLERKYNVVVTNPPYMSSGNMGAKLLSKIKTDYDMAKNDTYSAFIVKCRDLTKPNCFYSMITMQGWMFTQRFEELRSMLLNDVLYSMLHVGYNSFPELNSKIAQATSFTICKCHIDHYTSKYFDLTNRIPQNADKKNVFDQKLLANDYITIQNDKFSHLPGYQFAYWITPPLLNDFSKGIKLGEIAAPRQGLATGDNDTFLRLWYEVEYKKIGFDYKSTDDFHTSGKLYAPYNKGGEYCKWHGNRDWIIRFDHLSYNILQNQGNHLPSKQYYFAESATWSALTTSGFSCRYCESGFVFDTKGSSLFCHDRDELLTYMGFLNCVVANEIFKMLSPTVDYNAGTVANVPILIKNDETVVALVKDSIIITKNYTDSFETSWDFLYHPLVPIRLEQETSQFHSFRMEKFGRIAWYYEKWELKCEDSFAKLKANEEELNRIFIDSYGLQDGLSPEVKDKDVTVGKADLQRDIKSLLSYAVGCMFGRYSLDVEGMAYAGGDWDESKYKTFLPDADGVLPITDEEYLEDDIVTRLSDWLKVVYGEDTLEGNLDFIAKALGGRGNSSREIIRNYFLKDFFKDHCQTYSITGSGKRPIYWLFDSGKQNGFKALIYLHRYTPDTIGNLRVDYLHKMQRVYESEIGRMQDMIDHSTNVREVAAATKRKEKLQKQLKECREYDEMIGHLALSRIELDLDDGVKVNYEKIQTASDGKKYPVLAKI